MDVGVGSFVFSMGVVAIKSFTTQPDQSAFSRIAASLYRSLPIILLGMVRVIMVKGSEYPVSLQICVIFIDRVRSKSQSMAFTGTFSLPWRYCLFSSLSSGPFDAGSYGGLPSDSSSPWVSLRITVERKVELSLQHMRRL
jgi:hypothetical protein